MYATIMFALGLAALVPNIASLLGLTFTVLALEGHIRCIEEPHLAAVFGPEYQAYANGLARSFLESDSYRPSSSQLEQQRLMAPNHVAIARLDVAQNNVTGCPSSPALGARDAG